MSEIILSKGFSLSKNKFFLLISFFFSVAFLNTAWVAEDAFITFRAVDNLLAGHGAVWNIGERVQVYTHPLWYFLISIGTVVFKHSYYVVLGLSYLCLLGVLWCISNIIYQDKKELEWKGVWLVLPLFSLLLSRAFLDYSSSGLENPLVHLLLTAYVVTWISHLNLEKKFLITSVLYNLVFITRPDAIFIMTPASLYLFWQLVKQKKPWFWLCLISMIPSISWELFSLIYYGSFVPNTALAKVNIDYERSILLQQAYHYFLFNIKHDPLTLCTIILAFIVVWFNKNTLPKLLMLGVLLQILYICWVGADYMMGRFLSPSLLIAVLSLILVEFYKISIKKISTIIYSLICMGLFLFQAPYILIYSKNIEPEANVAGIADERSFYYSHSGLLPTLINFNGDYTTYPLFLSGEKVKNHSNLYISCTIGMMAWASGNTYWIDPLALSEPFLARLPAKLYARPGHYERAFPVGYLASRLTGKNMIKNPILAQLYDDVMLVVSEPNLLSKQRLEAIYRLNTGYYKNLNQFFDRNKINLDEVGIPVNNNESTSHTCLSYVGVVVIKLESK